MGIKELVDNLPIDEETAARILKEKAINAIYDDRVKNLTRIEDKALYVADYLLGEVENFEGYYASLRGEEESEEIKLLNKLYRVIHSSLDCHRCFDVHVKWREETQDIFNDILKKENIGP